MHIYMTVHNTLFLTDRVGPGRFICDPTLDDFEMQYVGSAAVVSGFERAQPTS